MAGAAENDDPTRADYHQAALDSIRKYFRVLQRVNRVHLSECGEKKYRKTQNRIAKVSNKLAKAFTKQYRDALQLD